jgi:hypothetical protein
VVEAGEQAGLVDEALEPGLEGLAVALALDLHLAAAAPRGQRAGHAFLDCHAAPQRTVVGGVDEAEVAFADQ